MEMVSGLRNGRPVARVRLQFLFAASARRASKNGNFSTPAMSHLRAIPPDEDPPSVASLDSAVPAQEQAKSVLRTEFAVFQSQYGKESLACHPVLLWGNHPGRLPASLVRALAGESGLPWVEATVGPGFSVEHIVSQLARQATPCREDHPLGIALLGDLHNLTAEAAHTLAARLNASEPCPHLHQGRLRSLSPRQVFWVGAMRVHAPSRPRGRTDRLVGGTPFALLAVGPSSADIVAAGVAGQVRESGADAEQAACLAALARTFKADALLLPGTTEDLFAWATAETEAWWPGRRLRAYCEHHGVRFRLAEGAAAALAAEAARRGGTADVMEDRLRRAMEPVLAAIADTAHSYAAVEVTPAAVALTEAPRLISGPRQRPAPSASDRARPGPSASGIERPARTPLSSPKSGWPAPKT